MIDRFTLQTLTQLQPGLAGQAPIVLADPASVVMDEFSHPAVGDDTYDGQIPGGVVADDEAGAMARRAAIFAESAPDLAALHTQPLAADLAYMPLPQGYLEFAVDDRVHKIIAVEGDRKVSLGAEGSDLVLLGVSKNLIFHYRDRSPDRLRLAPTLQVRSAGSRSSERTFPDDSPLVLNVADIGKIVISSHENHPHAPNLTPAEFAPRLATNLTLALRYLALQITERTNNRYFTVVMTGRGNLLPLQPTGETRRFCLAVNTQTAEVMRFVPRINAANWVALEFDYDLDSGTMSLTDESRQKIWGSGSRELVRALGSESHFQEFFNKPVELGASELFNYNNFILKQMMNNHGMTVQLDTTGRSIFGFATPLAGSIIMNEQGLIVGTEKAMAEATNPRGSVRTSQKIGHDDNAATVPYVCIQLFGKEYFWFHDLPQDLSAKQREAILQLAQKDMDAKMTFVSEHPYVLPVLMKSDVLARDLAAVHSQVEELKNLIPSNSKIILMRDQGELRAKLSDDLPRPVTRTPQQSSAIQELARQFNEQLAGDTRLATIDQQAVPREILGSIERTVVDGVAVLSLQINPDYPYARQLQDFVDYLNTKEASPKVDVLSLLN